MPTIAETFALAVKYQQAGEFYQAEQLLRRILQVDSSQPDVWYLLAMSCQAQGKLAEAEVSFRRVLQLAPSHAGAQNRIGVLLAQQGMAAEALQSFQQALGFIPDNADLHNNMAVVLSQLQQFDAAIASYREALRLRPTYAEACYNLGLLLKTKGRRAEARAQFEQALLLRPDYPEAANELGSALAAEGKLSEAVASYRRAIELCPHFADAHNNLGVALANQGDWEAALAHYREAVRLKPQNPDAQTNLGNALRQRGQTLEAEGHHREALRLRPDFAEAHANLGLALMDQGRLDEAVSSCRQAVRISPDLAIAHNNLGVVLERQDKLSEALACYRQALRLDPALALAQGNLISCLNFDPEVDLDELFEEHCRWGRLFPPPAQAVLHANAPDPERRLRIGYVSPDLRFHPVARYIEPVLANHDPKNVEVFCYAEVAVPDAVTARLQSLVPVWRWTKGQSDAQVAERIRGDGIDILVDLAGHTGNNRLRVFALKPAPVQVSWLGYLNTTGLPAVDYRLTDAVLDPPGQPVRDTEKLVRLPGGFCCFAPPADAPEVAPLPALSRGHLTFGSLNRLLKINSRVLDLWSRVLRAVPTARLLLFHHHLTAPMQDQLRSQFAERGIVTDRLDLRHGSSDSGYLAVYREIDVSLDTFPCTGGVTTCESLWMGVPVLSLCGDRPTGRNSASFLVRVGLEDWAVKTPEQFVCLAAGLFDKLVWLAQLRSAIRSRMRGTVCADLQFVADLEDAYGNMWRRWCAQGNRPSK